MECYERLKDKERRRLRVPALSTGITFALTEKSPGDKIPLITAGYGRSESQTAPCSRELPLGRHLLAGGRRPHADHRQEAKAAWTSSRARRSPWSTTTARSARPIPLLQERAKMHGFDLQLLPVTAPGVEQKATWLQVRQRPPDYVLLWGWGVMNSTALKGSPGHRLSRATRCTACGGRVPSPMSRTSAKAPRATTP